MGWLLVLATGRRGGGGNVYFLGTPLRGKLVTTSAFAGVWMVTGHLGSQAHGVTKAKKDGAAV